MKSFSSADCSSTHGLWVLVLLMFIAGPLGCDRVVDRVVRAAADRAAGGTRTDLLDNGSLNVFLCGTGSPLADPGSASACTLVLAGGKAYVVDVGLGSQEVAQLARMPRASLGGIFLTHFHSDHIGELGEWAMQSWVAGRQEPLDIYGPEGVTRVVNGFKQAYSLDDVYRIDHHGLEYLPRNATDWIPHPVPYENGVGQVILEENGLTVTAFAVDHEPVSPAVGYRFDYRGRSVVISGDTDKSPNLVQNAEGADVLVHEVLLKEILLQISQIQADEGRDRMAKLAADVVDYHTSPAEAVEIAQQAGVGMLVFNHLVPPVPGMLRNFLFMRGLEPGEVEVVLGEDGMLIELPGGGSEILLESP